MRNKKTTLAEIRTLEKEMLNLIKCKNGNDFVENFIHSDLTRSAA